MRPQHIIWIETDKYHINDLADWCIKNVGDPYEIVDHPSEYVRMGFNYNDPKGKWCCHRGNNVGDGRTIDTWSFLYESDATLFALKWA
jgi:uncharacterized protein YycO